MNGSKNFDKTDREHSLAPTDDMIRSGVKRQGNSRPSTSNLVNTVNYLSNLDEITGNNH